MEPAVADDKMITSKKTLMNQCVKIITGLNGVMMLIGLGVAGFGMFVEFGNNLLRSQLGFASTWITKLIQPAENSGIDLSNFDFVALLEQFSSSWIALGTYSLALSVFGTFAAKKRITVLIIVYSLFVGLGLLLQAAAVVIIFSQRILVDGMLKELFLTGLQEHYRGYNETNLLSQSWNIVMITLKCCGVNDYRDFNEATHWRRNLFQDGWWFTLKTPVACCNMERKELDDFACAVNPNPFTSNYNQGCYTAAWTYFDTYRGFPLTVVAFLMLMQLVLFIASLLLSRRLWKTSKKNTKQVEHSKADNHSPKIGNEDTDKSKTDSTKSRDGDESHNHIDGSTSVLSALPFITLAGYKNDENLTRSRCNSISQALLSQFLLGQTPYHRISNDYGFSQGPVPSFEFGLSQRRWPFEHTMSQRRTSVPTYSDPQTPIIVQLQQNEPKDLIELKAIRESPHEFSIGDNLDKEHSVADIAERKPTKITFSLRESGRCVSEDCIALKTNTNPS